MTPEIKTITAKKLIGQRLQMSFAEDKTLVLWRNFMPRRKEIKNALTTYLYSLQNYPEHFNIQEFNPNLVFEKWALVEVSDNQKIPEGMEAFDLPGGLYAVFLHKGAAKTGPQTFGFIFGTWLPNSDYILDNRPHFEILGNKYSNDDPNSEEEIWIPVKLKSKFVNS